jgi:hypothetical protein
LAAASGPDASSEPLASGSITAATRAIDLDMPEAANAILAGTSFAPLKLYNFSSPWPVNRTADITVMAAGVSAARLSERGHPYRVWEWAVSRIDDGILECVVYIYPDVQTAKEGCKGKI